MEKKWSENKRRRLKKLRAGTQLALARTAGHGGKRAGAGRKKKKEGRRNVAHVTRPGLGKRVPVHVTLRMRAGRASLRAQVLRNMFATIVKQIRRDDFHVAVFSLQHDHVHLICESEDRAALSSGIRRLAIRFALRMNKLFGRTKGKSWGDRYHRHDLKTPREVRNALVYVLMNAKKHGDCARDARFVDPFSSGAENDVWEDVHAGPANDCEAPRFWLLGVGWRKHGLLRSTEAPMPMEARARAI
jgi:REP element-mobilizing transposase RayT